MGAHLSRCNVELEVSDVEIIASTHRSVKYLMTLDALLINEIKPSLNTKDEYRSRTLYIKL